MAGGTVGHSLLLFLYSLGYGLTYVVEWAGFMPCLWSGLSCSWTCPTYVILRPRYGLGMVQAWKFGLMSRSIWFGLTPLSDWPTHLCPLRAYIVIFCLFLHAQIVLATLFTNWPGLLCSYSIGPCMPLFAIHLPFLTKSFSIIISYIFIKFMIVSFGG